MAINMDGDMLYPAPRIWSTAQFEPRPRAILRTPVLQSLVSGVDGPNPGEDKTRLGKCYMNAEHGRDETILTVNLDSGGKETSFNGV